MLMENKLENELENAELAWDLSPEQYQLAILNHSDDETFEDLMLPKPIFLNEDVNSENSLSTDDEVFMQNTPPLPTHVKLQRRNAIRRKKNATEPRVTRQTLINPNTRKQTRNQPLQVESIYMNAKI